MRPRKWVAVLGATELEASRLAIVLETRGYGVIICESEEAAMRIETPHVFVILGLGQGQRQRVESRLRLQHRETVCVMEGHGLEEAGRWMACVLERVRLAAARKRGPKPIHAVARVSAAGEVRRAQKHRRRLA